MGRPLRAAAGGIIYHVLNRANGRQGMFDGPHDYQAWEQVLMEAQIPYDYLIRVMDIVRSVEVPIEKEDGEEFAEGEPQVELVALFSDVSVGDAP